MTALFKDQKLVENAATKKGMVTIDTTHRTVTLMSHDLLKWHVPEIEPDSQYHIVVYLETNFWERIRQTIEVTPGEVQEIIVNTWTLKNEQTDAMMNLYDQGQIKNLDVLTGINFKSKRTDRYARIMTKLEDRGRQIRSFKNHAKICIFKTPQRHITIEGSANLWGHVAVEQFTITESKQLYDYNRSWMKEMMNK